MVYALLPEGRDALVPRIVEIALAIDGVDLALWRPAPREGAIANATGELRFAAGGDVLDERGGRWSIDGPLEVLDARVEDGVLRSHAYPDALGRAWSALTCPTSGDVLLSAAPGYEFADWGGVDHVGGGSHGSLHRVDSLGALAFCGVDAPHDHGVVVDRRRRADGARPLRRLTGVAPNTPVDPALGARASHRRRRRARWPLR